MSTMNRQQKTLSALFDYQRFARAPRLSVIIDDVEQRYAGNTRLTDDDLSLVSAAGEAASRATEEDNDGNHS